tara:strand:- start:556 stop:1188 length:633 start_codon:yes stop_codon:yes gene_type:complete
MGQEQIGNKTPLHELKIGKEVENYYDEWALNNKYNNDLKEWEYSGPTESVKIFNKYNKNKKIKIFDAGCGTGLVGIELKNNGYLNIDGADFSQKMLDQIPKGYYKNIYKLDLNKKLDLDSNIYDAILCVGTFTYSHVLPDSLEEMIRICKEESLICFTINPGIYEKYGFDKKIKELENRKKLERLEFFKSNYIASKGVSAWLYIARILND